MSRHIPTSARRRPADEFGMPTLLLVALGGLLAAVVAIWLVGHLAAAWALALALLMVLVSTGVLMAAFGRQVADDEGH